MNKDDLHHYEDYQIRSYDVDATMRASIPAIIQLLHDSATKQVLKFKLSALELEPLGLGWVLTHQHLEVFERPVLGSLVKVLTYPSGREKIFTYRDYQLFDDQNNLMCQATTTWLLVDITQRKSSTYPESIEKILVHSNDLMHLPRASDQEFSTPKWPQSSSEKSFQACYLDMDFNGHVSNHYFFKWMLNTLSTNFLKSHELTAFNVRLKGEVFADDQITSQILDLGNEKIMHRIMNSSRIVATGYSLWVRK